MSEVDMKTLRALAEKAKGIPVILLSDEAIIPEWFTAKTLMDCSRFLPEECDYISTATPIAVLSLLDTIERLTAENELLQKDVDSDQINMHASSDLIARLRDQRDLLTRELEEAKLSIEDLRLINREKEDQVIATNGARAELEERLATQPAAITGHDGGGFGLSDEQIQGLLSRCLKPEEIAGALDVQLERVGELVRWFEREGNPKWFRAHAFELVYYIATNAINRSVNLKAIADAAYLEGVNISPSDRGILQRLGTIPTPPATPEKVVVPDIELARLREIEHRVWHLLDNMQSEGVGDDEILTIDAQISRDDLDVLNELLPEDHPPVDEVGRALLATPPHPLPPAGPR